MPDASGRIPPVSVPACPWHESYWPPSELAKELAGLKARNAALAKRNEQRDYGPARISPTDRGPKGDDQAS